MPRALAHAPLLLGALVASLALSGCATSLAQAGIVQKRAAADLGCQQTVVVTDLGDQVFQAVGCAQRATYVVRCQTPEIASCVALLRSDTTCERPRETTAGAGN